MKLISIFLVFHLFFMYILFLFFLYLYDFFLSNAQWTRDKSGFTNPTFCEKRWNAFLDFCGINDVSRKIKNKCKSNCTKLCEKGRNGHLKKDPKLQARRRSILCEKLGNFFFLTYFNIYKYISININVNVPKPTNLAV